MRYFVLIELPKRKNQSFGVVVPDIPGCFSAGDSFEEALVNAEQAIVLQLEAILEAGGKIPEPSKPEHIVKDRQDGWVCAGVAINREHISIRAKRINITVPEGALAMIDDAAQKRHQNRSAFMTEAALDRARNSH